MSTQAKERTFQIERSNVYFPSQVWIWLKLVMERVYDYETFLDMNTICEYLPISNNFLDIFNEICATT